MNARNTVFPGECWRLLLLVWLLAEAAVSPVYARFTSDHSGLLASKTDHNNKTVSFTYTNGLPHTVTWARGGVVKTNLYNDLGELIGMDYSDSTPDVAYVNDLNNPAFNREGLPTVLKDATGTWGLSYD